MLPDHEWLNQEAVNADVSYNYQLYSMLEPHCRLHIQETHKCKDSGEMKEVKLLIK